MQWLLKKIIGTKNQRDVKKMQPLVVRINELEQQYQALTADQLKAKTPEFKERLAQVGHQFAVRLDVLRAHAQHLHQQRFQLFENFGFGFHEGGG